MRTKIVWLGSNYPEPGEYNQDNDTLSMNYVFNSPIPFEMVTVRYGQTSGTDAVAVTMDEINAKMPGLGPVATEPITGRHGGSFNTFGDYSMNLFEHIFDHINHEGSKNSRPLFDMAALAILKENEWAEQRSIPAPILIHNGWVDRPDNPRKIVLWENFDKEAILDDFFDTLAHPIPIVASQ
jgi:inosine-uridine nucleoside N-ribohydrolase